MSCLAVLRLLVYAVLYVEISKRLKSARDEQTREEKGKYDVGVLDADMGEAREKPWEGEEKGRNGAGMLGVGRGSEGKVLGREIEKRQESARKTETKRNPEISTREKYTRPI